LVSAFEVTGWIAFEVTGWIAFEVTGWIAFEVTGWIAFEVTGWIAFEVTGWANLLVVELTPVTFTLWYEIKLGLLIHENLAVILFCPGLIRV
jgi:hypothetical protein